ncbi:hypothetical protein KIL84_023122 [Mauremys mutica]|uniref:Uncharacterized protein n=1 Tax=Mauremys mutica TaxID=74926 RepID=A0A9D3WQN0_9SAUR|nr:hypothetical protein KIL84_023122 [Mauremys mutica]
MGEISGQFWKTTQRTTWIPVRMNRPDLQDSDTCWSYEKKVNLLEEIMSVPEKVSLLHHHVLRSEADLDSYNLVEWKN